jgi:HEAT repeat protein
MKYLKPAWNAFIITSLLTVGFTATASAAKKKPQAPNPDFTQGGEKGDFHDWTLGPTGARGWIYGTKGHTADSRQILITEVVKGSPADGVLQKGDVILGIGDQPFTADARISFGKAIGAAEAETGDGTLKLLRWRDGKKQVVGVKLKVIGSYLASAPYDCPKSQRIFEQGCEEIAKRGLKKITMPNSLNALALLASGNKKYGPLLADYAKQVSDYHVDAFASWHYGYAILFLAEYVAATDDKSVMPGLNRIASEIAHGASGVGTWGHRFAGPNGNCQGYGSMNSPGVVLATGLVIAREAGVKDPKVDQIIAKSCQFLREYTDRGAIPYGDHGPWHGHEDNGKCSGAAILFDLMSDAGAAEFFGKMSAAAYHERERGHTGNFFNMLWALPGVARCGPLATSAYFKEHAWYYDLARGWDGSFAYQGSPKGEEEHHKYTDWDSTGAYLLSYALPLKSLYLTGKKPASFPALKSDEVDDVIAAGRDYFLPNDRNGSRYPDRKVEQLLAGLSSWSPAVRKRSATELGLRDGNFIPRLMALLESSNRYSRYGACQALGLQGPKSDKAGPQLRALLKDPDTRLQGLACQALPHLGKEESKASVPALLEVTTRENPADPRGIVQRAASLALFSARQPQGILFKSLEGVDRDLLYPAVKSVLDNEDGYTRGQLSRVLGNLTDRDLIALLPTIVKSIENLAPSNEMFADQIRLAGLNLLSSLHIREGMPLCVSVIEFDRWGNRMTKCLEYLNRYGVHAKKMMPQLQKMREKMVGTLRGGEKHKRVQELDRAIAKIKNNTASPTILDLKDFKKRP